MKTPITLLIMALTMTIASCTKKGDTGPAGPQGAQGPAGPTGATGQPGNANVIGSNTVNLTAANWTASGNAYYCDLNVPAITQDVVDFGLVQVFIYVGTNTWTPLPYTPGLAGAPLYEFSFTVGALRLVFGNPDNTVPQYQPGNGSFRVVVITASQKQAHPHTDWNNYNDVMAIVNQTRSAQ